MTNQLETPKEKLCVIFGEYVRIYEMYGARYLSLIITGEYQNNLIGEYKSYTEGETKLATVLNDMTGYDSMLIIPAQEYEELCKFVNDSMARCSLKNKIKSTLLPTDFVLMQYGYETPYVFAKHNEEAAVERLEDLLEHLKGAYDAVRFGNLDEFVEYKKEYKDALESLENIFQFIVNSYKNIQHK